MIVDEARHGALAYMAIFPVIMLFSYLGLNFYFKSKGGYEQIILKTNQANP